MLTNKPKKQLRHLKNLIIINAIMISQKKPLPTGEAFFVNSFWIGGMN